MSTFIDPGVSQRHAYLAAAPENARFPLVFAEFKYPDAESEFYTAQRVFPLERGVAAADAER
jgi:hypothetical protein